MRPNLYSSLALAVSLGALGNKTFASVPALRVMPVGDSITDGAGAPGGYRAPLYRLMTNAGFNVDFVGTLTDNSAPGLPDPDHEGHSGWRIDQIDGTIESAFAKVSDPDVILLLIGTNDYGQSYNTADAVNRLEKLVTRMATNRPYASIIVANLLVRGEPYNTQIQSTFNPYLPALVQRQRALGREVYFDDLRSAVPLFDLPDQLHPGAVGYAKMATNWLSAITNLFTPQGSRIPPGVSRASAWAGLTKVTVVFSKPVDGQSVSADRFTLSGGLAVLGAVWDPLSQREVTLTTSVQQPFSEYTLTVNGVRDQTAAHLQVPANTTTVFKSAAARGASANVAEAAAYQLVYSLDIPDRPNYATDVSYTIDHRAEVGNFSRVAYYLELQQPSGPLNFIWVSMDAFTRDANQIGIPTVRSGALFQQPVTNMTVQSSVAGLLTGTNLSGGNIEFWPSNSSPANSAGVPNASGAAYDWGDSPSPGNYGCMQVHNHDARQVLFAFNRWGGVGGVADLGVGSRPGNYADWIFAQNASAYIVKTLEVFVLPAPAALRIVHAQFTTPSGFLLTWEAQPGVRYSVYKTTALGSSWTRVAEVSATSTTASFTDALANGLTSFYSVGQQ
jgi:lysophospholipase L1-like esterase